MIKIGRFVDSKYMPISNDIKECDRFLRIDRIDEDGINYVLVPLNESDKEIKIARYTVGTTLSKEDVKDELIDLIMKYKSIAKIAIITDPIMLSKRIRSWKEIIREYKAIGINIESDKRHLRDACKGIRRIHKRLYAIFDENASLMEKTIKENYNNIRDEYAVEDTVVIIRHKVIELKNSIEKL